MWPSLILSLFAVASVVLAGRTIKVKNSCGATVFPAYAGQGGQVSLAGGGKAPPGWTLAAGATTSLIVPDNWTSGRIWVRTGNCGGKAENCVIGKCTGAGGACDGTTILTAEHATIAEFGMGSTYGDFYDVSMVDGFNIAMKITPSNSKCTVASCGAEQDILKKCDPRLIYPKGSETIMSCASACSNGIMFTGQGESSFNFQNCPSCCSGTYESKCPASNAPFYDVYKPMCKNGYVFAKDDVVPGQTALFQCMGGASTSYTLELCAGGITTGVLDPPPASKAVKQDPGGTINVGGGSGTGTGSGSRSGSTGGTGSGGTGGSGTGNGGGTGTGGSGSGGGGGSGSGGSGTTGNGGGAGGGSGTGAGGSGSSGNGATGGGGVTLGTTKPAGTNAPPPPPPASSPAGAGPAGHHGGGGGGWGGPSGKSGGGHGHWGRGGATPDGISDVAVAGDVVDRSCRRRFKRSKRRERNVFDSDVDSVEILGSQ